MVTHQMKLGRVPFDKIASDTKVIESRLYDEKRRAIKLDDQIEFSSNENPDEKILTRVKALYIYPSFEYLFADFSPNLFGGNSKEELLKEINHFYSPQDQKEFGVVGIRIEKVQ